VPCGVWSLGKRFSIIATRMPMMFGFACKENQACISRETVRRFLSKRERRFWPKPGKSTGCDRFVFIGIAGPVLVEIEKL
jgi:hypothetical protein